MSQIQSFFISSYAPQNQCEDLNHFLRSHKIIRLSQGFVQAGENPGFQILVEYAENSSSESAQKNKRVDYRAMLKDEKQKSEFDSLKDFRSSLCKKDKLVGAYMICKDEHLYEMVTRPEITLEEILSFPHSANIKLEEYGKILFDHLVKIRSGKKNLEEKKESNESEEVPF